MLGQRKDALESKVADLEKQLDRMVGEQTRESRDTARKLSEAASGIRDNKIKEKIRYSKSLLGSGAPEQYARNFEEEIGANIDQLRKKLDEAASSVGQQGRDRSGDAVDKARELARGVDSLGRRMQERAQQNAHRRNRAERARRPGRPRRPGRARRSGRARRPEPARRQGRQEGQGGQARPGRQEGQGRAAGPGRPRRSQGRAARPGRTARSGRSAGPGWPRRRRRHRRRLARRRLGRRRSAIGGPDGDCFGPDDIRQFRGEARRWAQEGQALRNMLREQNVDPKELDEIMQPPARARFRARLPGRRGAGAAADLRRRRLKRFEYALRRKVGDEADRALVSGSEEVPGGIQGAGRGVLPLAVEGAPKQ